MFQVWCFQVLFTVLFTVASASAAVRWHGGCPAAMKVPRPGRSAAPDRAAFARIPDALLRFLAENVTHVPQAELEKSLGVLWGNLAAQVPKDAPIVVWSRSDRSNGWIALLLHEALAAKPPAADVTFFDNDYSTDLFAYLRANPTAHAFIVDDAAYSAVQVRNTVRGFRRVLPVDRIHVGVAYATLVGETGFREEHPGVDFQHAVRMRTLGEILADREDLRAMTARLLGAGWESKVITYFDHTIADEKSTVTLRDGRLLLPLLLTTLPDRPY